MLKEGFELVLGGEAGVGEETIDVAPFVEAAIIEGIDMLSASLGAEFWCKDTYFCRYRQEMSHFSFSAKILWRFGTFYRIIGS